MLSDKKIIWISFTVVPILCYTFAFYNMSYINLTVQIIADEIPIEKKVDLALKSEIPYVLGALIGTNSTGFVIDKCGSRAAAIYLLILCVITQLLLLYYNERETFDGLAYLVSMLCGFE